MSDLPAYSVLIEVMSYESPVSSQSKLEMNHSSENCTDYPKDLRHTGGLFLLTLILPGIHFDHLMRSRAIAVAIPFPLPRFFVWIYFIFTR